MRAGALRHRITIELPAAAVPDSEGGFTQTWSALASRIPASVTPATARDLERVVANTVQSTASHLVTLRYLAGVTTKARLIFHDRTDRTFSIQGIHDPEERHLRLNLACEEVVT